MKKTNFVRGADIPTTIGLGNIRIVEKWLDHYGLPFDKEKVTRSMGESGNVIIELQVDDDIDATILSGNPDWKSGRSGSVKIVFQLKD